MRGQKNPINRFFNDMKRRLFVELSLSSLALTAIAGCSSAEDKLRGKWEVVRDDGSESGTFAEFLSDRTAIFSTPQFQILAVYDYKIIEGDRLSIQFKKTGEIEIFKFRLEGGYLYLKSLGDNRELKHKRI